MLPTATRAAYGPSPSAARPTKKCNHNLTLRVVSTRGKRCEEVLIKSTLIESLVYAEILGLETTDPAYTIINSLLLVLFVLHVYWTYLILKVVVRQFSGKELKDIRENDEGSDSD
eukprot:gene10770-17857_t